MKSRSFHARVYAVRHQKGVTLIELLLVMVIIAILSGIAIPAYKNYVVKTNRSAAKACLSEYAQFMERYYTSNLTYAGASPGSIGCASDANLNVAYNFTVSVNVNSPRLYTVTATPVSAQYSRDTQCGTLSLDQTGTKTKSGTAALSKCW
jgi:type IV pilus assembly protein PilE